MDLPGAEGGAAKLRSNLSAAWFSGRLREFCRNPRMHLEWKISQGTLCKRLHYAVLASPYSTDSKWDLFGRRHAVEWPA